MREWRKLLGECVGLVPGLVVGLVVVLASWGATMRCATRRSGSADPGVLRAQRLEIVDAAGRTRIVLRVDEQFKTAEIALLSANGGSTPILILDGVADEGHVALRDAVDSAACLSLDAKSISRYRDVPPETGNRFVFWPEDAAALYDISQIKTQRPKAP